MKTCVTGPLFILLVAGSLSAAQTSASPSKEKTPAPPTFHASTRLVVVDVVVTRHDQPVPGLKPEDFTVLEDGKVQKLAAFEPHLSGEQTPEPPHLQLPPHQFTNLPTAKPGPVNIVLFDLLNTFSLQQVYAKKQMIEFLQELPPGHRLSLFVLSTRLRMIQGFTGDSDTLIAASKALQVNQSPLLTSPDDVNTDQWINSALYSGARSDPAGASSRLQSAFNDQVESQENQRLEGTLHGLALLAGAVSAYPGRKNVMWLSTNFPFRFGPTDYNPRIRDQRAYLDPFQSISALFAAAQIAVYPIDIGGLSADGLGDPGGVGGPESTTGRVLQRWDTHDSMSDIARETGGKAYYGANDFKEMMQHSLQQGENYYTLSYVPENHNWNGKYRKIDVKVSARDARLEYRRGYYALSETQPNKDDTVKLLASAMQPSVPECTTLLMRVQVLPPDKDHATVTIDYAVMPQDVVFNDGPDHLKHAQLDFMAIAWDRDNKQVAHVVTPIEFHVRKDEFENVVERTGVPAHQELEMKPGSYVLRVGVIDRQTERMGTVTVPLTVQDEAK